MPKLNLTDEIFGKWKVLHEDTDNKTKESRWVCECECGTIRSVSIGKLRRKRKPSRSCGCAKITHGMADKDERYGIWLSMKRRCDNSNVSSYPYYGGRGIEVCERWMDFAKFCVDMGP